MGKFNTQTGGQISEIDKLAHVELPTGNQVQEETQQSPQSTGGSVLEQILSEAPDVDTMAAGLEAGLEQEAAVEAQLEREHVPDIITRRDDESRIDNYNYSDERANAFEEAKAAAAASNGPSADGGLAQRAKHMGNVLNTNDKKVAAIGGLSATSNNVVKTTLQSMSAFDPDGRISRPFGNMLSVVTENAFQRMSFNESIDPNVDRVDEFGNPIQQKPSAKNRAVSKIEGNRELGQQIHMEWSKYKNAQEGNPQAKIDPLPEDQAVTLGDVAKEMYFRANENFNGQQFLKRYTAPDGQVNFELTPHAVTQLAKGSYIRKKMFPKNTVRPSKVPLKGGKLLGEGRSYTRSVSGKAGPVSGKEILEEAMHNLGRVPNVVDPKRLKILLATALPVLSGEAQPDSVFAGMNHVGKDKMDSFIVKAKEDPNYNAEENYESIVNQLAQDVFNAVQEKDGANYLSYYIQAFNGRVAPQQVGFDPTSSKTIRFVTRNAVPAKATPGSRIEKNLRQMYAMMLVPKKYSTAFTKDGNKVKVDSLLPAEREIALEKATPELIRWGKELKAAIDSIPDAQVEAIANGIKQGVPISKLPKLPVPNITNPDLVNEIQSKGEDGQAFIDGVIDFYNYYENKVKGKPHFSFFNAYMDGKTNGLAANGIQMGSENVAYKTGVIRSQGKTLLDNDEDIRDALKNTLLEGIDNDGFAGVEEKFNGEIANIARKLYSVRDLNKATTMTFGYGMELGSMKKNIKETLNLLMESDPEFAASVDIATNQDPDVKDQLINALHSNYTQGLANALDPDALASRSLMRSAAILHALTNEMFTIKSPIGLDLNFGATTVVGSELVGEYGLYQGEGQKKVKAYKPTTEVTSAAPKRRTDQEGNLSVVPGDIAYGGSVPGPVQSTDAATVALTASGKSWRRLHNASGGNPYLHTIYDAFKVDAMGYDVVLEETNRNWLKSNFNWSYLKETKNAVNELNQKWKSKMAGRSNSEIATKAESTMFSYLLQPELTSKGKPFPLNLLRKMNKLVEGGDADGEVGFKATLNVINQMKAVGYNVYKPTTPTVGQLKAFVSAMGKELNLSNRLGSMIDKVESKKEALRKKINADGAKVYQYYAH